MSKENDIKKEAQENIRASLEAMLLGDEKSDIAKASDIVDGEVAKLQHPDNKTMDFYAVKEETESTAKKVLASVMTFYLTKKMIKKDDYVRFKSSIDEMNMSNLQFSLRTTQHAIIKMLQEIDMGNTHPRIFEVLATLNGQLANAVKHMASYMLTLEEGYKKIRDDKQSIERDNNMSGEEEIDTDTIEQIQTPETDLPSKVRGTKGLMQCIQDNKAARMAVDVPVQEIVTAKRLTDPGKIDEEAGKIKKEADVIEFGLDEDDAFGLK